MNDRLAGQILWQGSARRLLCIESLFHQFRESRRTARPLFFAILFERLDRELELGNGLLQLLRGSPKLRPLQARELEAQLLDLDLRGHHLLHHGRDDALQRVDIVGKVLGLDRHADSESYRLPLEETGFVSESPCRTIPPTRAAKSAAACASRSLRAASRAVPA